MDTHIYMPCIICGISENGYPLCGDCGNNKDVSYYDLSIRMPSVRYLANLAKKRHGLHREETINRIHDILLKHPTKRLELPVDTTLYTCSQCHITFTCITDIVSRYYEALKDFRPLCEHCMNITSRVSPRFGAIN